MGEVQVFVSPRAITGADKSPGNNPIARAIRDRLSKPASVAVHTWHGHCRIGDKIYALPESASKAEALFVSGGTLDPFHFKLVNEEVTPNVKK